MKRWIALLCLMLMVVPIYGSSLTNKKEELSNNKQDIANKKEELTQIEKEQVQLEQEVEALDKSILGIENSLLETEADLEVKEAAVESATEELEAAVEKKEIQYEATKARMVQMYKNQKIGYLQIIFSSDNFWDMLNRLEYIRTISKHDQELLVEYNLREQEIQEKKAVLESEKEAVETLHTKQLSQKTELDSARKEKNVAMGTLEQKQDTLHAQIDEMEKISKDLEAEIKKLTAASTVKYNGGAFSWPVPGYYRISSQYNPRSNPISGNYEFHQGIDIPAPFGKSVVAAADGRVITSGWVRGFGNTIMIDHGSGIVTIYGHNSSLSVANGTRVTKGQEVAKIGSTGYSTGNHCHFEVRINGAHTSPWNYLKQ